MAEWLGSGLQNRLRRFDSSRHLIFIGSFDNMESVLDLTKGAVVNYSSEIYVVIDTPEGTYIERVKE